MKIIMHELSWLSFSQSCFWVWSHGCGKNGRNGREMETGAATAEMLWRVQRRWRNYLNVEIFPNQVRKWCELAGRHVLTSLLVAVTPSRWWSWCFPHYGLVFVCLLCLCLPSLFWISLSVAATLLCPVQEELLHIMTIGSWSLGCCWSCCLHHCAFVVSCIFFAALSCYSYYCCFHPTHDISIFFQVLEHVHVVVDISSRNKRGEFEIRHWKSSYHLSSSS